MKKINWVNFLHIYQPPWQDKGVIEQASSESYEYLFGLLDKYPKFITTLNITGSLVEQLEEFRPDLLKLLQALIKKGKVELTGSAKYHALLPLLPTEEIKRQILLNEEILSKYFFKKPVGFYMPEMAYSKKVAEIVKDFGYQWIVLDAINLDSKKEDDILYEIKNVGLKVIFRDRKISKSYPAEVIYKKLKQKNKKTETIITGTDGEMYGHFHKDWQGHLEKILQDDHLSIQSVSQYINNLTDNKVKKVKLLTASWETTAKELKKGVAFALWQDPKNKIHRDLWKLTKLAIKIVNQNTKDSSWKWARWHLDRGLASCTFWWASATKPSDFSPLTWNPDMIDNGSEELVRSVRSLHKIKTSQRLKAERLYIQIKKNTWETHWRKYHK
ncbi:polysaccharide deacetylase family protein [bacterium]|jgi:predicted glycosyl hydrolase (DUF1957 family)|nr:polysaccharide deacetylase family protein [bacterium]MBT4649066.1 polysaccharide deacetylase family protein [bacterium]